MILLVGLISLSYTFLLLFLLYGFHQLPVFSGKNTAPKTTFSIVIPYRNEAENLMPLFSCLRELQYPSELFEILLVNDASEDESAELCEKFKEENPHLKIRLLESKRLSGSPKKDAVDLAVRQAAHDFILTTDADCLLPKEWLNCYNSAITMKKAEVVAGPVRLETRQSSKKDLLYNFQQLDIFSLQAATMGSFGTDLAFMCNAANFCYSKKAFLEVNGFEGNQNTASGDDVFLLQKFQQHNIKTCFLKIREAVVLTRPQANLKELLSQRIRWAGKSSSYKSLFAKSLGLIVLLMNLLLVICSITVLAGWLPPHILFLAFLFKFNTDFALIYSSASFFGQERILKNYFWASLVYPFFSSYVVLAAIFGGYEWKGRQFKN